MFANNCLFRWRLAERMGIMNSREYNKKSNGKNGKGRKSSRKRYRLNGKLILSLAVFFICSMLFFSAMVNAKSNETMTNNRCKYYTSVQIQSGDTLTSIAKEHCPEGVNAMDYLEEIKYMNGLTRDFIRSGNYLMIYYYED